MNTKILQEKEVGEILGRGLYWREVHARDNSNTDAILSSELRELTQSIGNKILWVLEEYAKEARLEDERT